MNAGPAPKLWVPGGPASGRGLIRVQPDTEYSMEPLDVRFSVSYDMPLSDGQGKPTAYLVQMATPHVEEAVRIKEKDGWTPRWERGVKFSVSPLQADTDKFGAMGDTGKAESMAEATDGKQRLYKDGMRDMVATVWFVRPLDWVLRKELRERRYEADGFTNMPASYNAAYQRETGTLPAGATEE